MTEEDLKNINEEADFEGPLVDYRKKGNNVELVGKDKVEDKDVWRVKMTTKNGDVRYYLFDATTFLLLKWEGKRQAQSKEIPMQSYYRDYREVGGMNFALHRFRQFGHRPDAKNHHRKDRAKSASSGIRICKAGRAGETATPAAPGH